MLNFLKYTIQLLLSPGKGWEDISYAGKEADALAKDGLYPIFGLAAASTFCQYFYNNDLSLVELLSQALVVFVQYFVSLFLAPIIMSFFIDKCVDGEPSDKKVKTMATYSLAILAIITIISNCLPTELSIVQFLPIYVALIMWKSSRYLSVSPSKERQFIVLAICAVMLPPFLLGLVLNLFI